MSGEMRCEPQPELRKQNGWHWVQYKQSPMCRAEWSATEREWFFPEDQTHSPVESLSTSWRYLAPVTPPGEVEQLRAERDDWKRLCSIAEPEMAAMKTELTRAGAECADAMAQVVTLRSTVAGLVEALEEADAALVDMLEHLTDGNWIADAAHEKLTAAIARAKGDGV